LLFPGTGSERPAFRRADERIVRKGYGCAAGIWGVPFRQ
jgi:hypothetical protein